MTWVGVSAVFGFLAVAFGAFGAHALRARLSPEAMGWFQTGVQYHFWHTLAAMLAAVCAGRSAPLVCGAFLLGVVVFSGSLYALALTGQRWLGAITPIGGVLFLVGWGALAWVTLRR